MKNIHLILAASALLPLGTHGATVVLDAQEVHGGVTTRTSFTTIDGFLTLTPTAVGVAAPTFSGVSGSATNPTGRLGTSNANSNANAFNDPNTTLGDAGGEGLLLAFTSNAGLSSLSFDFSRANVDGNGNGGVRIAGFLANPNVVFSGQTAPSAGATTVLSSSFNPATGVLSLNIPIGFFTNNDSTVSFDPTTSAGQTLALTVEDTTTANAQLAITTLSFDDDVVAIPEPSSALLLGLVGFGALLRRKR